MLTAPTTLDPSLANATRGTQALESLAQTSMNARSTSMTAITMLLATTLEDRSLAPATSVTQDQALVAPTSTNAPISTPCTDTPAMSRPLAPIPLDLSSVLAIPVIPATAKTATTVTIEELYPDNNYYCNNIISPRINIKIDINLVTGKQISSETVPRVV
jgi:hypothetical protein